MVHCVSCPKLLFNVRAYLTHSQFHCKCCATTSGQFLHEWALLTVAYVLYRIRVLSVQVALLEERSPTGFPISVLLGSVGANGLAVPNLWMDPVGTDHVVKTLLDCAVCCLTHLLLTIS